MSANDEVWKRKMLVQNIPEDWSLDMLENFIEVVTKAELEESGVEHFCRVKHRVLLTFKQPVTEEQVQNAETESRQREKSLLYFRIAAAPASVLVTDIGPTVTYDNLLFYFESSRSGCMDGTVEDLAMYPRHCMAVITFNTAEVAAAVLASKQHTPSKGMQVRVETCYEQFHKKILDDLESQQTTPDDGHSDSTVGRGQGDSQSSGPAVPPRVEHPLAAIKPRVAPKPVRSVPAQGQLMRVAGEEQSDVRSGRDSGDTQPAFQPEQGPGADSSFVCDAPQHLRGGRGHRRKPRSRGNRRGRHGCREDGNQPGKPRGNGDRPSSGGRPPFRGYRGRGRGDRQKLAGTEMFDCGPGHASGPSQGAAPRPIVLDAYCNPLPQGWGDSESDRHHRPMDAWAEEDCQVEDGGGWDSDPSDASLEDVQPAEQDQRQRWVPNAPTPGPASANTASSEQPSTEASAPKVSAQTPTERWAEVRAFVLPPQPLSQLQREKEQEAERLKQEKMELEKKDHLREQEMLQLKKELDRVRQEKEALKNHRKETRQFPAYQLRLMQDFPRTCSICDITIHEKEGTVEFVGTGENFETAMCAFLCTLQDSEEESLDISSTIAAILRSEQGQQYLLCVNEYDHSCAFDVQDSRVVCTAFSKNQVQKILRELQRNIHQDKVKVSKSVLQQLQLLKHQLESDFPLARLTLPAGDAAASGQVMMAVVDGINGDFELMMRELRDHCSRNEPCRGEFLIQGALETRACRQWCSQELDSAKALILKNSGDCQPLSKPSQEGFSYECHKDVSVQVQHHLNNVRKVTKATKVNLQHELKRYSERALVINGMQNMGVESFCRLLEEKLKNLDTLIHFSIPPNCLLPKFEFTHDKGARPTRQPRPHAAPRHPRVAGPRQRRPGGSSIRPFTKAVGNTSLTIKSGDITSESVDGIVCVVAEDMDLNQTAVGQAIVKKYPYCAQLVAQGGRQAAGRVITKPMQQNPFRALGVLQNPSIQRDASTLHLVVLTKWSQQNVVPQIKILVQKCLQNAVQHKNRTIAFPPLGMGRKFQFPLDDVVNAMVTTAYQFLQSNSGLLQSIMFVIYDVGQARQFREAAKKIIQPPMPAFMGFPQQAIDSASDEDNDFADDDADTDDFDDADDDIRRMSYFRRDADADDFDDADNDIRRMNYFRRASADDVGDMDDTDYFGASAQGRRGDDYDVDDNDDELSFFHLDDDDDQRDRGRFQAAAAAAPAHAQQQSSSGTFEAQLCLRNAQNLPAVKVGLLKELRNTFLHEDQLNDMRTFKKLGFRTMEEIKATAISKCVVLSVQNHGGREVLVVRGQKVGVTEMMAVIKDKQHAHQQKQQTRDQQQPGTMLSTSNSHRLPPYWKVCQNKPFKNFQQFLRDNINLGTPKLYTMGSEEVNEIRKLIETTWNQHLVGAGKDARNLGHSKLQVVKVERLENPQLWEEYCTHRERLIRNAKQQAFLPVEKAKGSTGPIKTTSNIRRGSLLNREMFPEVNEHYLFHGTKKDYIQAIHDQGLDTRIANEKAMLGRGVYAAESATKADQYTDDKANRTSGNKTMILLRVLLGEPYINKQTNPTKYSRPPCKKCFQDRCKCHGAGMFDSVIDDCGRNFREFVLYDRCMCYPEYFITYKRV